MKRYTYFVSVGEKESKCPNVLSAVAFINETLGCDLVSSSMVFNYFTRPHVVNKKILGQLIKIYRVETKALPALTSQPH